MTNPWKLSPREAEVMTMMADQGSQKAVAYALGVHPNTVQELIRRARVKLKARTRVTAIVQWDRWARAQ